MVICWLVLVVISWKNGFFSLNFHSSLVCPCTGATITPAKTSNGASQRHSRILEFLLRNLRTKYGEEASAWDATYPFYRTRRQKQVQSQKVGKLGKIQLTGWLRVFSPYGLAATVCWPSNDDSPCVFLHPAGRKYYAAIVIWVHPRQASGQRTTDHELDYHPFGFPHGGLFPRRL